MIHHANHIRPKRDGLKVGGHQASCASVVTLMSALYFAVLRPQDRVAVKPHASPVFHAIQYLLGRQTREALERFRAWGGAQSYPSRTKDHDDVDFSTGSVGLGVAVTLFASLVQDYLRTKRLVPDGEAPGRMVALVGDAELDEGNVFEAMLEGWKHGVGNAWWVIDYNRQSLDRVVQDRLFQRVDSLFSDMGWNVRVLKYGRQLEAAFAGPGGDALRTWIDECPNSLYSALVYKGGAAWREHLRRGIGDAPGVRELLERHDDGSLHALMTNLGGHDLETVLDAFESATDDRPTCFLAYTIKGYGLPFAGHKDNHAGLMTPAQMEAFRAAEGVPVGAEWEPFSGAGIDGEALRAFLPTVPFAAPAVRWHEAPAIPVPASIAPPATKTMSTQEGFGRILTEISHLGGPLADRLVTASPDVTISTNLGGWVNRRGVFDSRHQADVFRLEEIASPQKWEGSPAGQHIELGIAENNLFLLLAALGLSGPLFGARLLPVGTLYDPFIARGLDALNYACYQDARFLLVATPSGITLAPEGGAHQSVATPLVGIGQPGLLAYEPAYADELAEIMRFALEYMQAPEGGSVYLRLSTRPLEQLAREVTPALRAAWVEGGTWIEPPAPGAEIAIAYMGVVAPEAREAFERMREDIPGLGLLSITSPDRLHAGWRAAQRARAAGDRAAAAPIERLLGDLAPDAALVTVLDGHPAALSWLGAVRGHRVVPLGVDRFGQSADVPDLYEAYGLTAEAIVDAAARALLDRMRAAEA
ncbi:MAG: 1-deoxy-D-xylulose-5-phosphate synthase N-terminal domain-containing protein [Candidatus Binatia bacterium]